VTSANRMYFYWFSMEKFVVDPMCAVFHFELCLF
jgi:hypothetical protein